MDSRTRAVAGGLAAALVATVFAGGAVIAASRHPTGVVAHRVDEQTILWRTGKGHRVFTKSTHWRELQMPTGGCVVGGNTCSAQSPSAFIVSAKGPISLTFSGNFTRAPVELRFRDGRRLMKPGTAKFRPQPHSTSFSYAFVSNRRGVRTCTGPRLLWRSPTGGEVRLNRATIVVHYKRYVPASPVGCA